MTKATFTESPLSEQVEPVDMNLSDRDHQANDDSGMEKPAITDLQAVADEFNAAFNTALYELESSRKLATERSIRIDELNESIKSINSSHEEEVSKNRRVEEEYQQQAEQLNQRIQETESDRDNLSQQLKEHENTLNTRTEEISQLSSRFEQLTATLEQRTAEGQRIQEELTRERDRLTGEHSALGEQLEKANSELNTLQNKLEGSDRVIADINRQIETLNDDLNSRIKASEEQEQEYKEKITELDARNHELSENLQEKETLVGQHCNELESKSSEIALLNASISQLQDENSAQATSIQMKSEDHARASEELESRVSDISGELETMRAAQKELEAHSEKLENLNRALHESSISENELHKKVLDEKDAVIESFRTKLAAAGDTQNEQAENLSLIDTLQSEIRDLQSRLQQAEQAESCDTADVPGDDTEELKSALAASEEEREQLQAALSSALESSGSDDSDKLPATHNSPPVTDTADRKQFLSSLDKLLAEQPDADENNTVMYLLLDNFIRVRDEIGIMNSEHVIKEISEIIESFCNDNDDISRFGDCTFAVLSRNESNEETHEKAEKIRSSIEHHIFQISDHSIITSSSIGICRIRGNDTSAEEVILRADLSCEAARSSGGNKIMVNSAVTDEMNITGSNANHEKMVSAVLSEDRMMIYYQPITSLKDNPGNYFEILTRIVDESGDIILPGEFFSMAESSGRAVDIDLYVIEKVFRMMAVNRDREMMLFVKLTRESVADHDFPIWVMGKIKEYNLNPEQLVFEIAESTMQTNLKNLSSLSRALHDIGCKIAIEHYKMSTKPQHLLHIHTDFLKIDSSLVENISRKGKSFETVTAIMNIARKNNYITIAEGVENPANLTILWELGVSLAQGYFIQAPAGNIDFDFHDIVSENKTEESNKSTFTIG